jgi:hypothetical protein
MACHRGELVVGEIDCRHGLAAAAARMTRNRQWDVCSVDAQEKSAIRFPSLRRTRQSAWFGP